MEKILSQFTVEELDIKLTSEKLFINTKTSSETFALRSIFGIGVVDLIDDYNLALRSWKAVKIMNRFNLGLGIVCVVLGFWVFRILGAFSIILILFGGFIILYSISKAQKEPNLMSVVRIMMNGGNRDFQFNKSGVNSEKVNKFIANVESTLTAYHKNKD